MEMEGRTFMIMKSAVNNNVTREVPPPPKNTNRCSSPYNRCQWVTCVWPITKHIRMVVLIPDLDGGMPHLHRWIISF